MMGAMFPMTQIGRTWEMGMPNQTPTGTAPLNSTTGMAEMVASTAHFGNPKDMIKLAIFWPVCKCSTATTASLALANAGACNMVKVTKANAAPLTNRFKALRLEAVALVLSVLAKGFFNNDKDCSWVDDVAVAAVGTWATGKDATLGFLRPKKRKKRGMRALHQRDK
jgi:hypothetical protein